MLCPNCQTKMHFVKTPSLTPGYFVTLDQCSNCGGIWCDRFEMYQIPNDEAKKINVLDQSLFHKVSPLKDDLRCPKDSLPLTTIYDVNIPSDAQIKRCRQCEGVWLNQGELNKYKDHVQKRQTKISAFEKKYFRKYEIDKQEMENDQKRVVAKIANRLLPMPLNFASSVISHAMTNLDPEDKPFILSDSAVELIKKLPQDKKMAVVKMMAQEHDEEVEDENRFINATVTIFNIITKLIFKF